MLKACIRTTPRAALVITTTDGPAGLKVARRWFDKVHADTFLAQTAVALDSAMSTGGWVALKGVVQPCDQSQIPKYRAPPYVHRNVLDHVNLRFLGGRQHPVHQSASTQRQVNNY